MTYIAEAPNVAVIRNPACVSPETKVIEAMTVMSGVNNNPTGCVVVVDQQKVLGILTERDMIRLVTQRLPVEHLTLRQVLSDPPVTVRESVLTDLVSVLNLFEQHQISYLPIVDDYDKFVGLISQASLQQELISIVLKQTTPQKQLEAELEVRQQTESQLRASKQRYTSLVAASPVGILHTDLEGICTYANGRYCEIIGIEPSEIIGQPWSLGHSSDNQERINQGFEQCLRENLPFYIEYSVQRPDGIEIWVYGQAVVEYDVEGQMIGYVGTATDISDRKLSESLLANQHKILERIAKAEPLSDIFDILLKTMESYLSGSVCSITLCRDGQLCDVTAPSLPHDYAAAIVGLPIAEGVGSCGTAAFRRELVVVNDIENDPLWENYKFLALDYGLQSCSSIPIFASDQELLGVFGIYYREKKAPKSQELEWIAQAANIAGIAIEREQAVQELKQLNQALEDRVQERTIELQMSERRYASLAAAAPVAIFRFDTPLHCVYVNERWSEMVGGIASR
jgi:PAS domain S-box-containing protein